MGDEITGWAGHLSSDLPSQVNALAPTRWPAIVGGSIGGPTTGSALGVIDDVLADYPGRFVALCFGTNDANDINFTNNLEILILKIIAAGKTPVIPHIPWSDIPAQLTNELPPLMRESTHFAQSIRQLGEVPICTRHFPGARI